MKSKTFVILIGPPAVGKMTVGQELKKLTGLPLFHNHQTIDTVLSVFDFDTPQFNKLVAEFRNRIFEEIIESDHQGVIFTFVWAFNDIKGEGLLGHWSRLFQGKGGNVYMVELYSSLEKRLERNSTENRLLNKSSKRDLEKSKEILISNEKEWTMEAPEGFTYGDGFLRINNENMPPQEVAQVIKEAFNL